MEIATDIMAILGWGALGALSHGCVYAFRSHESDECNEYSIATCIIAFALIAASLVLE